MEKGMDSVYYFLDPTYWLNECNGGTSSQKMATLMLEKFALRRECYIGAFSDK